VQKKGKLPGSIELNFRAGKKVVCTTWKTPEELSRMCRHGVCPTGLWGCVFGPHVSCMSVEPWQWKKILLEEEGDGNSPS